MVYNLISALHITRLFIGDAIIPSKTDPHNGSIVYRNYDGSKKEKGSYGKA